jgi:hypothetical protein
VSSEQTKACQSRANKEYSIIFALEIIPGFQQNQYKQELKIHMFVITTDHNLYTTAM